VLVDQGDAASYVVGEEVTFLRWGNIRITSKEIEEGVGGVGGRVLSMRGEYEADSTNFSKTKKATWIANVVSIRYILSICLAYAYYISILCIVMCIVLFICLYIYMFIYLCLYMI
jgi:hypothetical protein